MILFKQWVGVARKIYNESVNYYNRDDKEVIYWMSSYKIIFDIVNKLDYVKRVPNQVRRIAVRDCYQAFINGCKKAKETGEKFRLKYKSKKNPTQSCFIPKTAVRELGIYHRISGKLSYAEKEFMQTEYSDCRLIREYDRWYLCVSYEINGKHPSSENKAEGDVVALDPGIRTFMTFFSENGFFGKIGEGAFEKIKNLNFAIDHLISKKDTEKDKHKIRNLKRRIGKLRLRNRDLVDELHWKAANFLARNFSVIILPTFETSEMVRRNQGDDKKRKLRKSVARSMQALRFYEFSMRLEQKCNEYGVRIIRSNEAYTSKTNSFTGEIMNIGSRKSFRYDGITVDRDLNGARNILLRAMRDSSLAC